LFDKLNEYSFGFVFPFKNMKQNRIGIHAKHSYKSQNRVMGKGDKIEDLGSKYSNE
jgi:hypothetical protein